jgi:hypothetical protein
MEKVSRIEPIGLRNLELEIGRATFYDAVMSNHSHLILHIDKARSDSWSMEEVISR